MIDIVLAQKRLKADDYTIVIVNTHKIIYSSQKRGIFPLYDAITNENVAMEGASVADKVTGKGAALLCAYGKIKSLYTDVISTSALDVLLRHGIEVSFGRQVDHIKNREGDGRCPVETLSEDIDNPEDVLLPIEGFLKKTGVI